ncbi:type II toxin-antitoxin system HicB family antitoxin [Nostoc sp.]|uniref:type II toxin-antitoxin system HicB family antitoxin n=1 Tax=Nostoc sp. TaxID=1180 RepID=UPI002FF7D0E6
MNRLSLHVLVEQASEGHFIASVPELPDYVAEAETRSDAIAQFEQPTKESVYGWQESPTFFINFRKLKAIYQVFINL